MPAIYDQADEVRQTCLDHLQPKKRPEVTSYFVAKLKDKKNEIVNLAGIALGRMKDPAAIGPLIEALVTTHKFTLTPPGGNNSMNAGMTSRGGMGLSMGSGAEGHTTSQLQITPSSTPWWPPPAATSTSTSRRGGIGTPLKRSPRARSTPGAIKTRRGKRGQAPFAGTARRVLRTNGRLSPFSAIKTNHTPIKPGTLRFPHQSREEPRCVRVLRGSVSLVTIFAVTPTSAFAAVIAEYDLQENPITNGTTAVDSSGYAPETDLTYYSTDTVPTLYSTSGGYYGGSDLAAHFNYGSTSYYQDMVYGPSTSSKMLYYQQTGTIEVAFKIDAVCP